MKFKSSKLPSYFFIITSTFYRFCLFLFAEKLIFISKVVYLCCLFLLVKLFIFIIATKMSIADYNS